MNIQSPTSPTQRSFRAFGTTATIAVTDPAALDDAASTMRATLQTIDETCSRFRDDAEIVNLYIGAGRPVPVSDLLFEIIGTAADVALLTDGAVDPTVGRCIEELGYDRDFAEVDAMSTEQRHQPCPAPGWWTVALDPKERTVAVPTGVHIDVGSTGKAFAADRVTTQLANETGCGVLVSLGGDIRTAGPPPPGGWAIGIAIESATPAHEVDLVVTIDGGALASSAPGVRRWFQSGRERHHIVDPVTGVPVPIHWSLVSATAPTCVEANALTTAAIVWGADAVRRLAGFGHPVRLVRCDGEVITINGWPEAQSQADNQHEAALR